MSNIGWSRRATLGRPVVGTVAFVVALATVVGCSTSEKGTGTRVGSVAASSPDFSSSPSAAPDSSAGSASSGGSGGSGAPNAGPLGAELASAALSQSDLSTGFTIKLIDGGDQVNGQITLDNCGFNFTTEANRVARRQYDIVDQTDQDTGVSNELVAYDSAASATLALSQWHQAAATCPKTPVHSTVAGEPDSTIVVTTNTLGNTTLPISTNSVIVESITAEGDTEYFVAAIQIHGQFLDAVYDNVGDPPDADEMNGVLQLAATTGVRLARL
jgi:hypothetical protein